MNALYAAGLLFIVIGALMLMFPNVINSLNRFSNELEGVETRQGETYHIGQKLRAAFFILIGILLLFLPGILE